MFDRIYEITEIRKVLESVTTKLPSSKLVIYLNVQKSRADANVVGAYT